MQLKIRAAGADESETTLTLGTRRDENESNKEHGTHVS